MNLATRRELAWHNHILTDTIRALTARLQQQEATGGDARDTTSWTDEHEEDA